MTLTVVPITLRQAAEFVAKHHRHSRPPKSMKFAVGLWPKGQQMLVGAATAARPSARALDDGFTIEVARTCTDGTRNANSKLYGAVWQAARAMGYTRGITYTEEGESGASLRGAGWSPVAQLEPRADWKDSTKARLAQHYRSDDLFDADRKPVSGRARVRWEIRA